MKKYMKKIFDSIHTATDHVKSAAATTVVRAETAIANTRGEGYVDSGVKILIAVVVGGTLLAGLYKLFNFTIMPAVSSKITELFNFKG